MIRLEHRKFNDNEYWTVVHTDERGKRTLIGEIAAYCKKEGGGYSILAGAGYDSIVADVRKEELHFETQRKELLDSTEKWLMNEAERFKGILAELREWREERCI